MMLDLPGTIYGSTCSDMKYAPLRFVAIVSMNDLNLSSSLPNAVRPEMICNVCQIFNTLILHDTILSILNKLINRLYVSTSKSEAYANYYIITH
jgi:hypothetical protein